jgi:hypothetical protein
VCDTIAPGTVCMCLCVLYTLGDSSTGTVHTTAHSTQHMPEKTDLKYRSAAPTCT